MNDQTAPKSQVLHLVRFTIEAVSPLSVGSGEVITFQRRRKDERGKSILENAFMTALVRDANGLPTIPGASLQGVLRHLYADAHRGRAADLFGHAEGNTGRAGRLVVGFGGVHDAADSAVVGIVADERRFSGEASERDALLAALRADAPESRCYDACGADGAIESKPGSGGRNAILRRDHVALNERHVADGRKKFERLAVPAGTRFSFEIAMWGAAPDATADRETLAEIVGLLGHPSFRIGGATRRGYGKVKLVRASYACPDLDQPLALRALRSEPPSTTFAGAGAQDWANRTTSVTGVVTVVLTLEPINPWRIGGTSAAMTECTYGTRASDGTAPLPPGATPADGINRRGKPGENDGPTVPRDIDDIATIVREPRIAWSNGKAEIVEPGPRGPFQYPVPGSALKGPLVHRAVFHWNRLQKDAAGESRLIDLSEIEKLDSGIRRQRIADLKPGLAELAKRPAQLERLFGTAKERTERGAASGEKGRAARVLFDDGEVRGVVAVQGVDHISIDRFTGGVRAGFLFVEEALVGGTVAAVITILPPANAAGEPKTWPDEVRNAFCRALRDLCEGRLAIGAKSLGFCRGDVAWSGDGAKPWQDAWLSSRWSVAAQPGKGAAA
jgi:CRISPR/Cas system CSM-associated protein Csm3 (group 7 of RAMP superfamily)